MQSFHIVCFLAFCASVLTFQSSKFKMINTGRQLLSMKAALDAYRFSGGIECKLRNGLEMTDALSNKIEKKISPVIAKFGDNIVLSTSVTLKLEGKHQAQNQIVDIVCTMKGGGVVEATVANPDMYASIDLSANTLKENLKKHREKAKKVNHTKLGGTMTEDELDIANET